LEDGGIQAGGRRIHRRAAGSRRTRHQLGHGGLLADGDVAGRPTTASRSSAPC
jgi:hypothetical protein